MPVTPLSPPEAFLERFGLAEFREGQREVIATVLAGRDCLCIMPTGGGKSLCYQLPAVARDGVTLVVSPLIALMKDQVDALQRLGLRASFVNSSLSPAEQHERLETLAAGGYDLLYVAPERFRHQRFLESLRRTRLALLAIDEAHCISEWGHDFRPDYARLGEYRRRLGNPPTIALTATATGLVRDDVVKVLNLADPAVFITGFARPNLRFEVQSPNSKGQKSQSLLDFLEECQGAGIIYAATRKRCEELVELLRERTQRRVGMYHAGMESQQRRTMQEAFMSGRVDTIVATNAFGMGIDKANLRFVVHFNIPGSLEAYYQEAGRAGRDGQPSRCLLLFSDSDRYIQEFFIENAYPSRQTIKLVWDFLRQQPVDPIELTQDEIKEALGGNLAAGGVGACLQILDRSGAVERIAPQQNKAAVRLDSDLPTLVDLLPPKARSQRKAMRAMEQLVGADRRGERVFFTLREAVARSGMEQDALIRSLRELNRLEQFSFIPPFRGKATHVRQADRSFEQLEIDFEKLDQLREAEYKKLDLMVQYAHARQCRQMEILEYFGDPHREPCGNCDRCDDLPASKRPKRPAATSLRLTEVVRMALSGVARAEGRFGKKLIAQMLFGSDTAQIRKWRLQELSTYGILSHLLLRDIETVLDALLDAGLAAQKERDKFRPVLTLTAQGTEVMRGAAELPAKLRLPHDVLAKIDSSGGATQAASAGNGQAAAAHRTETPATAAGKQANSVAAEKELPGSASAVARAASAPATARPESPQSEAGSPRRPMPPAGVPQASYYWTWHLLADGYAWTSMLSIRGIAAATALAHLQQALAERREVEPSWFLSPERLAEAQQAATSLERPALAPMQEQLGDGWLLEEIDLFLKCRGAGANRQT